MRDRLLTLALAIGAFAAFYAFFIGPNEEAAERHSRPLSTETRANGYFAFRRWLETEQVRVTGLRHRYDWLRDAPGMPGRGNLLVTTIPHQRPMRPNEATALKRWVASGNDVLVLAGIFDTPEWGMPDVSSPREFHELTGLWITAPEEAEDAEAAADSAVEDAPLDEPKRGVMKPVGGHPLTLNVRTVHALSEYAAGKFEVSSSGAEIALALMTDEESGLAALWVTWLGEGRVVASGYGSILTNKLLGEASNAEFAANVVATSLGPGGHVIFDDIHQGAASIYDARAFYGDSRLHASFWWIMGLWLLWVLGSTRLPQPAARPAAVRERGFVEATGNFLARTIGAKRAAARLFANFFNDCRRAIGEPEDGRPLWEWLRGYAAVPRAEIDRLESLHARVERGRRVDLVDLHNRLQHLRKQLA